MLGKKFSISWRLQREQLILFLRSQGLGKYLAAALGNRWVLTLEFINVSSIALTTIFIIRVNLIIDCSFAKVPRLFFLVWTFSSTVFMIIFPLLGFSKVWGWTLDAWAFYLSSQILFQFLFITGINCINMLLTKRWLKVLCDHCFMCLVITTKLINLVVKHVKNVFFIHST